VKESAPRLLRRVIEHVKAQNWTAVALDFVIVVMGVLFAFWITAWNEAREDRARQARDRISNGMSGKTDLKHFLSRVAPAQSVSNQPVIRLYPRRAVALNGPVLHEADEMGEHVERGGLVQALVDIRVHGLDDGANARFALFELFDDLRIAHQPVRSDGANKAARLFDGRAMGREIDSIIAREQRVKALEVGVHVSVGRRNDGRRPAHYVIAGKKRAFPGERKAQMIGKMSRRMDRFNAPARPFDGRAVADDLVRRKAVIGALVKRRRVKFPFANRMRPEAENGRAHAIGEAPRPAAMIAMGVRDQDMGDAFAGERRYKRVEMRKVVWTRINDGDLALADNVGSGAGISEGAGIIGDNAPHAGVHVVGDARREVDVLDEGDVGQGDIRQRARARSTSRPNASASPRIALSFAGPFSAEGGPMSVLLASTM